MMFKRILATGLISFFLSNQISAQTTTDLNEVVVSATRTEVGMEEAARNVTVISRKEIENAPVETLAELLEFVANVDVRQRGANGVQSDLSIRGSSFEQVLVLLNGVKMTDPQTGHHNLNLPIELMDIERIEVLHGGAARVFGPGAFAGAINVITKNPDESKVRANIEAGDYGYTQLGGMATLNLGKHSHSISFSRRESDGYIRNTDYDMTNFFWQSELHLDKSDWFVNLGQNERNFGAQNFYTTTYPHQYEATKTQFASFGGEIREGNFTVKPKAYYRLHTDRFELYREDPDYYMPLPGGGVASNIGDTVSWYNGHNYHKTDVYGAELSAEYKSKFGTTSIGYDFRSEAVKSNVLGESMNPEHVKGEKESAVYDKSTSRENHSFYFEHTYAGKKFFASAGLMFNHNSAFGDEIFPGVDVAYQLNETFRPYASINRSFRMPSFTDLYYNRGGAVGSIDLMPEESINFEMGTKFNHGIVSGHVAYFQRRGENLIDWIRYSGSDTTRAANITEATISGVETDFNFDFTEALDGKSPLKSARVSYTYLYSDTASTDFESNYVLDYLTHKADVTFHFQIVKNVYFDWLMSYQAREGEYRNADGNMQGYDPVFLTDMRISPQFGKAKLFVQVSNVFNQHYYDIAGIEQAGRWFRAGLTIDIGLSSE